MTASNLGIQLALTAQLQTQQTTLAQLDSQLSSSKKYSDLTDYTPADALNLMNLQNSITQKQGYISAMTTVQPRLTEYDATMTDMESIAAQAQQLAAQSPTYDPTKSSGLVATANSYLQGVTLDLNQEVGNRYIYSGSRYTTAPVVDLTNISVPPTSATPTSSPTLPDYDTAYTGAGSTSNAAWTQDSVTIDSNFTIQYGVNSNATGFQQLVDGLRYLKAAGQATDSTTYQTDIQQASTLLQSALSNIQASHTQVAASINTLENETTTQNNDITNLNDQISNIQQVDLTQVSTEINLMQTQLSASYSATASIEQLSILKYL